MAQDTSSKKLNFATRVQQAIDEINKGRGLLRSLVVERVENGFVIADFPQSLFDNTALKHLTPQMMIDAIGPNGLADALDGVPTGAGTLSAAHRATLAKFGG